MNKTVDSNNDQQHKTYLMMQTILFRNFAAFKHER